MIWDLFNQPIRSLGINCESRDKLKVLLQPTATFLSSFARRLLCTSDVNLSLELSEHLASNKRRNFWIASLQSPQKAKTCCLHSFNWEIYVCFQHEQVSVYLHSVRLIERCLRWYVVKFIQFRSDFVVQSPLGSRNLSRTSFVCKRISGTLGAVCVRIISINYLTCCWQKFD